MRLTRIQSRESYTYGKGWKAHFCSPGRELRRGKVNSRSKTSSHLRPLRVSPPHQSGEQHKKHQKNADGKNNSPQVWSVSGDPCPKDRSAAERQQDVQESDDNNLNILRDRHWRADLSWPVQYAQLGSIRLRRAIKKASCSLTQSQACATRIRGTFGPLSGHACHAFHGFRAVHMTAYPVSIPDVASNT